MKHVTRFLTAAAILLPFAGAVETRTWSQKEYADFERGNLKKLSLASDGRLMLAPVFREVFDSSSAYLWALAEDSRGNLYAGGGGPGGPGARLYVIPREGKGKSLAELAGLEIHALAIDKQDRVYAGASPDGRIYRIAPGGKPEVFYDPQAKYIWGMVFDSKGNLYVATGDRGEIHRVAPSGKGGIFYKTTETHARSLAIDSKDNLVIGTDPGGLIIRVTPKGEGFVLYQAARREITAVAVAGNGCIYAAAVGARPAPSPAITTPPPAAPVPQPSPMPGAPSADRQPRPVPSAPPPLSTTASATGGSEVYRIDPEGFPRKVWSHAQDIAYSIAFDLQGRPLIGTGNRGIIYRLDSDLVHTVLLHAPPTQVTFLYTASQGRTFAATGNIGQVYQIGPGLEKEGTIESEVFDAGTFSYWGRLSFRGKPNGGEIALATRSGNLDRPQQDWSPWSAAIASEEGGRITSPPARFIQWKATFRSAGGPPPELQAVEVAYRSKNLAPVIEEIEITPANYRFPPMSLSLTPSQSLTLPPLGRRQRPSPPVLTSSDSGSVTLQFAKGHIGARWAAGDENADELTYTVQIRGEKESEWKLLKDKVREKHLSWDSIAFPDGEYRLRVIASDAPSNPLDQALTAELVSDPFVIDNTPPEITGLVAAISAGKLSVRWRAIDARSVISRAECSVNGGEWLLVEPADRLSDSREEEYSVTIDKPSGSEQTVAVRVTDDYENQSVAKIVVRP